MLADPRARAVVGRFNELWLQLGYVEDLERDSATFPTFTVELPALMAEETRRFLDHVIGDAEGSLTALFTSPGSFMNQKLAAHYGATGPVGDAFTRVEQDPARRFGLLTQGGILSMLAKTNQTSPVDRGKSIRERFLCGQLPPPPANVEIIAPDLSPALSTRERINTWYTQQVAYLLQQLDSVQEEGFTLLDSRHDALRLRRRREGRLARPGLNSRSCVSLAERVGRLWETPVRTRTGKTHSPS